MKYILILIFLALNLVGSATTYYISTNGNDATGNGSISNPWKSLYKAGTMVSTVGDIIHVTAGNYTETQQCNLKVGVSIIGEGDGSHIISHYNSGNSSDWNNALISLYSSTQSENGNQSISYILFDGDNLTGPRAIYVKYRNRVSIHHCTFVDFNYNAIDFHGENRWDAPPSVFSAGNKIYNNTITNCNVATVGDGSIRISGQTELEIYNNTVSQLTRGHGVTGQNIIAGSNNKGTTIHNNVFNTPPVGYGAYNFVFEFWDCLGGVEIRDNTFNGGGMIDIGGHYTKILTPGEYAFSVSIHDNDMLLSSQGVYEDKVNTAIDLESWGSLSDIYIYNNHIKNFGWGIEMTLGNVAVLNATVDNIYIYSNLIENVGFSNGTFSNFGIGIKYQDGKYAAHYNNVNILNNTIIGGTTYSDKGIIYDATGTDKNISIKNNIIQGFNSNAILFYDHTGSIDGLQIANNMFSGNGTNSASIPGGITVSNYSGTTNYTSNPLFFSTSDFHLQSGSPAIAKGIKIAGITSDYDGKTFNNPPSIGAFESGTGIPSPEISVYQSSIVQNVTPSVVEMTYNLSLAAIIPAATAFNVMINSVARTISNVAVSGTKISLTLASPIVSGDIITVSYTKPVTNPLQTTSAGQAATFSAQSVTNSVSSANTLPIYVSSSIQNATPNSLEMIYNLSLANIVPAASVFSVLVNSVARTVSTVAVSGTKVSLTLASPVVNGDVVTVSYTKPATNLIQTTSGGQAASISARSISNNIVAPVKDATSAKIKMTIYPNPVHQIINAQLEYNSSLSGKDAVLSPQIMRIFDISGKLFIEKLLVAGVASIQIPINLKAGIYTVMLLSSGLQLASQKIIVY
jgi:uncharacterized repeat protein (TIGR02059 family)